MRVQCDVCGQATAAVLCCADEAALCSACDRRVHRANRLAGKHRRLPLVHPSSSATAADGAAAPPLCDVCKERRGLVFCVEDRAILCADCDEPIHAANDLTAKHTRFLLVGAKLSAAALDDHPIPSPDTNSDDSDHAVAAEAPSMDAGAGAGGAGGSSISEYLTNICPGWRVEDLLADAAVALPAKGRDAGDQVPFIDADLFDVVAAGRPEKGGAWAAAAGWGLEEVSGAVATAKGRQGHVRDRYWSDNDSDAFAVPEISPSPAKRTRPSPFWRF